MRLLERRVVFFGSLSVLALMLLGALKRSFGGFDRATVIAPITWGVVTLLLHVSFWGRPLSMSAIDDIEIHGPRLAASAAAAAVIAIALGTAVTRRALWTTAMRRGAGATALLALVFVGASIANVGGALGPWPLPAWAFYGPILTIVSAIGTWLITGMILLATLPSKA
jgi:hypothetical protein